MIVDYNYKYSVQVLSNTTGYTITKPNNKGLIYYPGQNSAVLTNIYPLVNFYQPNGTTTPIQLVASSGSIFDLYLTQFKHDQTSPGSLGSTDIHFPIVANFSAADPLFLPIQWQSLTIPAVTSWASNYPPILITLY